MANNFERGEEEVRDVSCWSSQRYLLDFVIPFERLGKMYFDDADGYRSNSHLGDFLFEVYLAKVH
jgi:hypothetical protein